MEDQQDQDDEHIAPGHPDELQLLRDQNRALIKRSQTLTKKSQKLELEVDLLKAERSQRDSRKTLYQCFAMAFGVTIGTFIGNLIDTNELWNLTGLGIVNLLGVAVLGAVISTAAANFALQNIPKYWK